MPQIIEEKGGLLAGIKQQRKIAKQNRKALLKRFKWKKFSEGINKRGRLVGNFIQMAFRPVMTFLIMSMVYMAAISIVVVAIVKTIGEAWKFTSKVVAPFIGIMLNALAGIWEGVSDVFSGIINGDLNQIIDGVIGIAFNILQFVVGLALAAVIGLGTLVLSMAKIGAEKLFKFVKGIFTGAVDIKKNFGKILLLVGAILALFFGWPAIVVAVLVGILPRFINFLVKKVEKLFSFFNTGGTATGGMSIVGEKGPELVKLPIGSRVKNNHVSKRTASSNRGGNIINITINAKDTSDAEMRRIAEKVGRLVNNSINRNTGMSGIR